MRVPLSWLREFVDVQLSVEELAERLTLAGLEVSAIDYVGVEPTPGSVWAPDLGAATPPQYIPWDRERILVGELLEVRPHPNADRLTVPVVGYGEGRSIEVVTGAPNIKVGMAGQKVALALAGARLIDGHSSGRQWVTLKPSKLRGVRSEGMVCSELELGLSDEHEGILFLPDETVPGTPLADYLGDVVLDIDLTLNLARALSILGVAREVAALTGAELHRRPITLQAEGPGIEGRVQVTVEDPEQCPRFTAGLIEGVKIGPSPFWLQRRLLLAGMRPISNIVDVSNYVMLELGEPSHAFDADCVMDRHLIVRQAYPGERLETLDGKVHELTPDRTVVADPSGALSVAGVMGGSASEVSEKTTNVLLEAALWNPASIRRTAQALKLPSEASRRFERGVDPLLPPIVQQRCLQLMQQIAGGVVAQGVIDVWPRPWTPLRLEVSEAEVRRLLGIDLSAAGIGELLERLGFGCEVGVDSVLVEVPAFRLDVAIVADLIEEIARVYGYHNIPATRLADELPPQLIDEDLLTERFVKDTLVACELYEAISYSITSLETIAAFAGTPPDPRAYVQLENPLTPERMVMRREILPELLAILSDNLRERPRVALFELGRVFYPRNDVLPDEPRHLAIVMAGARQPISWHDADPPSIDFFDLKGVLDALLRRLNLQATVEWAPARDARFHPGRSAELRIPESGDGGSSMRVLGIAGELHPAARERLGIGAERVCAAELDLDALIRLHASPHYQTILRQPATYQDIAVVVPVEVPAERIRAAIQADAGALLERVELFDVYTGSPIPPGQRSLAFRMAFRAPDRTLEDAEVSKIREKIGRRLAKDYGATIRA
ncbi:MAG TPA: phenylalanine--tRNA ligase subunit beta [Herpetosiphonaceae bacterium]|nr:phenylalanine--tRNA ligase subunit beta [Herpetosiphonaceae bacterium]